MPKKSKSEIWSKPLVWFILLIVIGGITGIVIWAVTKTTTKPGNGKPGNGKPGNKSVGCQPSCTSTQICQNNTCKPINYCAVQSCYATECQSYCTKIKGHWKNPWWPLDNNTKLSATFTAWVKKQEKNETNNYIGYAVYTNKNREKLNICTYLSQNKARMILYSVIEGADFTTDFTTDFFDASPTDLAFFSTTISQTFPHLASNKLFGPKLRLFNPNTNPTDYTKWYTTYSGLKCGAIMSTPPNTGICCNAVPSLILIPPDK